MEDQIIDSDSVRAQENYSTSHAIISTEKFVFLSIVTMGLYPLWWIYKAWRYFKHEETLDIIPVARTIFSIIFLGFLFSKIHKIAKENEYKSSFSPWLLYVGVIIFSILGNLPPPLSLISVFTFVFFLPPFNALNFLKQNSTEHGAYKQTSFNTRQIVIIIIGVLFWILYLASLGIES